jgi:multiple antibiotic resistance protein
VLVALGVLIFFLLAGGFLLEAMHVPIRAFQIAGGVVLFLVALEMIRGGHTAEANDGANLDRPAIYPLAIPKIASPGAMVTAILLADDDRFDPIQKLATIAVLAAVLLLTLVMLWLSEPFARFLGAAGAGVISRVMGMLLAALAVSFLLSAVAGWLNLPSL